MSFELKFELAETIQQVMSERAARMRAAAAGQSWHVEEEEEDQSESPEEQWAALRQRLVSDLRADAIEIPPLPKVAVELHQLATSPDPDLRRAQTILERDPQLAGRIAQVACSPAFGGRAVTGLEMAVVRLGTTGLRDIAMAVAMGRVFRSKQLDGYIREQMQHSFAVASASKTVCSMLGLDPHYGFLCGLFHDIGRLTIGMAVSTYYSESSKPLDMQALHNLADAHHEQVGAHILSKWGMHNMVKTVAAHHHTPASAGAATPMAMAIAAADAADRIEATTIEERIAALTNMAAPYQAGLTSARDIEKLATAVQDAKEDSIMSSLVS